jgi:hypothetical protein
VAFPPPPKGVGLHAEEPMIAPYQLWLEGKLIAVALLVSESDGQLSGFATSTDQKFQRRFRAPDVQMGEYEIHSFFQIVMNEIYAPEHYEDTQQNIPSVK